jgi:tetratricopeptide (TPR) repeat protein
MILAGGGLYIAVTDQSSAPAIEQDQPSTTGKADAIAQQSKTPPAPLSSALSTTPALKAPVAQGGAFVGSQTCNDCHTEQFENWRGSHHDLAMQLPDADSVLGDFNNSSFSYAGVTTRFYRQGDKFIVETDGEDGKLTKFEVAYVFGVHPLQQYLLPLSQGRLQALSIAWDARPEADGGQRWYHLYPDEVIDYEDPLHWTGPYHNWNTRCAECHSTNVQKNYDFASKSYDTQFDEVSVGCESCHGPGESHLALAAAGELAGTHNAGFPTDFAQRGSWIFEQGQSIARRSSNLESRAQVDSCGRCHARRGTLGDYHYGADLLDTHRVSLPQEPLYHPDGQILDEVYVYGSFLQSKMHQAGVVCSNCHEPHSLELRAPGNATCAQCHAPSTYDTTEHHHHTDGSAGALCATCHMPETTYMGVDPRRDHSMRIPRPDLSVVLGIPNACNQCHTDTDAQWSLDALRSWGVEFHDTARHPARAFAQINQGDARAVPTLARLVSDTSQAPIWRAAALEVVGPSASTQDMQGTLALLRNEDSLLRFSAVRALANAPLQQRFSYLLPLASDDITSVRMEVATALAPVPLDQIAPEQAQVLEKLFDEYLSIYQQHADMPGVLMQLGLFYSARGDAATAEKQYREAIALNHQLLPAYLNLADLLRSQIRDNEARELLLLALTVQAENSQILHALGLLETRSGDQDKALDYLRRSAELESNGTRHRLVYAIALHDLGQPGKAVTQLQTLLRASPENQDVLVALANYLAEMGDNKKASGYAKKLATLNPQNQGYQQLYRQLSGPGN